MLNRYDTPAQDHYFNTFVPLPLDQITGLGMQRQEDLMRKQDLANKLYDQYSLVNYIPGSVDEDYIRGEYIPMLNTLAEQSMTSDLTNPVEYAKVVGTLKRAGTAERIRRIEQSRSAWDVKEKAKAQLKLQNKYNSLLDEDPSLTSKWDSANAIYDYMPSAYEDKATWLDEYYKGIEPDVSNVVNVGGVNVLRQSITRGQLNKISDSYAQSLTTTPQGMTEIKLFRKQNPELSGDMSDTQIMKTIMDDYSTKYQMHHDQVLPENLQGNGSDKLPNVFSTIGQEIPGDGLNVDPAGVGDVTGFLDSQLTKNAIEAAGKAAMSGGAGYDASDYSVASNEMANKMYSNAAGKIIQKFPNAAFAMGKDGKPNMLERLPDKEIVKNYEQARKNWNKSQSMRYRTDNQQVQDQLNTSVAQSISGRKVYISSLRQELPVEEFFGHLGYTVDEAAEIMGNPSKSAIKITGPSMNGDVAGWYSMSALSSKGKTNKWTEALKQGDVMISGDDDIRQAYESMFTLKNVIKSGRKDAVDMFYNANQDLIRVKPEYTYSYKDGKPYIGIKLNASLVKKDGKEESLGVATFNDLYNLALGQVYRPIAGRNPDDDKTNLLFRTKEND
jgi:hypothetical protein